VWAIAIPLVVVAVIALELFVRARGYQPSVKDDEHAWVQQRARAADSARTVALLGASRIQLGFSPPAFREALPRWTYVQLAIDGTQPAGSLRDLAADPAFTGVALVETTEDGFTAANRERQDAYVTAYHRRHRAPGAMLERVLATAVQSRVALVGAAGMRALHALATKGTWPKPPYVVTGPDRTQFADFALADVAAQRRRQIARIGTPQPPSDAGVAQWLHEALELERDVDAIQQRGGKVVYLRMPTCDERWAADEISSPKARMWDALAARSHATMLHFRDHPTLADFACPDMSHIASSDGPRFTRAVIDLLVAREVIEP